MSERKIITSHEYPPIPVRSFDWCAHWDDYEPPDVNGEGGGPGPVGWGATEAEAIADFKASLDDEDVSDRLIAAAPDMLAALHLVLGSYGDDSRIMDRVRAAIEKAEGRS